MIDYKAGDILRDDAEALVNTVNTVGVMGKGIALQFKRQFPANFDAYRKATDAGEVEPGRMFVWFSGRLENPRYVINFPTKRHWKSRSRLEDIEEGLRSLQEVISELDITSIAVPPLGCGHGGLGWSQVRPLIEAYLRDLPGVDVRVYEPVGAPAPETMAAHPKQPRLTAHRAAMLVAFDRYLRPGFTLGRLEAQKIIYFLKVAGVPFQRLQFEKGPYGPYADGVRHVLNQVEGHFIVGFGDADAASKIRPLKDAVAKAEEELEQPGNAIFRESVENFSRLTAGFDDAFGLELLSSVHWLATNEDPPARNAAEAARMMAEWSRRKGRRYDEAHIRTAWWRLQEENVVAHSIPDAQLNERSRDVVPPTVDADSAVAAL